jgi:hypothetical protein
MITKEEINMLPYYRRKGLFKKLKMFRHSEAKRTLKERIKKAEEERKKKLEETKK